MTRPASKRTQEIGFTLVEVLAVVLLLGIMTAIVFGTVNGIIRSRNSLNSGRANDETARNVLGTISKDMESMAKVPLDTSSDSKEQNNALSSKRAYLEGKSDILDETDADSIAFVSASGQTVIQGRLTNYGYMQVSYYLKKETNRDKAGGSANTYLLLRQEAPASIADDDARKARTVTSVLANNVVRLNFRYLKDDDWLENWSQKEQGQLPSAVEIYLEVGDSDTGRAHYKTAVAIPLGVRQ